jgi:hypothetical protein
MRFIVRPVIKDDGDADVYDAVAVISKYFIENPDEPYVELLVNNEGVREVVGRINNPQFTKLIYDVSYGIDQLKRKNAVRTVEINTK